MRQRTNVRYDKTACNTRRYIKDVKHDAWKHEDPRQAKFLFAFKQGVLKHNAC